HACVVTSRPSSTLYRTTPLRRMKFMLPRYNLCARLAASTSPRKSTKRPSLQLLTRWLPPPTACLVRWRQKRHRRTAARRLRRRAPALLSGLPGERYGSPAVAACRKIVPAQPASELGHHS